MGCREFFMTQESKDFGVAGEKAAEKYLKKNGYRIIKKNYRTPIGEIDIIAEQDKALVFIEVKSRKSLQFGHPIVAVTSQKRRKIIQMSQVFLKNFSIKDRVIRFDVVTVLGDPECPNDWEFRLFQDVFRV